MIYSRGNVYELACGNFFFQRARRQFNRLQALPLDNVENFLAVGVVVPLVSLARLQRHNAAAKALGLRH